jgi:hypothetical protein
MHTTTAGAARPPFLSWSPTEAGWGVVGSGQECSAAAITHTHALRCCAPGMSQGADSPPSLRSRGGKQAAGYACNSGGCCTCMDGHTQQHVLLPPRWRAASQGMQQRLRRAHTGRAPCARPAACAHTFRSRPQGHRMIQSGSAAMTSSLATARDAAAPPPGLRALCVGSRRAGARVCVAEMPGRWGRCKRRAAAALPACTLRGQPHHNQHQSTQHPQQRVGCSARALPDTSQLPTHLQGLRGCSPPAISISCGVQ